jgi:hypothetical protein
MTIHIVENDSRDGKFAELKKLSTELYVPVPEVFVRREIMNPGCETIIKDSRSHTWVRNYYNLIFTHCSGIKDYTSATYGAGDLNFRAINGTVYGDNGTMRTSLPELIPLATYTDTAGILIGTSSAAYSFDDYALGAKIAHGTGSGQMSYQFMEQQTPVYISGTKEWVQTAKRVFNNNSSGAIGVKEVGWGFRSSAGNFTLLARDVLGSTDTINVGGQYTVTYTVKLTFPA